MEKHKEILENRIQVSDCLQIKKVYVWTPKVVSGWKKGGKRRRAEMFGGIFSYGAAVTFSCVMFLCVNAQRLLQMVPMTFVFTFLLSLILSNCRLIYRKFTCYIHPFLKLFIQYSNNFLRFKITTGQDQLQLMRVSHSLISLCASFRVRGANLTLADLGYFLFISNKKQSENALWVSGLAHIPGTPIIWELFPIYCMLYETNAV